ncbi:MAG: C-terminal binding protein [Dehalococcoidia bacterium]
MAQYKVAVTDTVFPSLDPERKSLLPLDADMVVGQARTEDEVIPLVQDADVVFVTYAPITAKVIQFMQKAQAIIRSGIGVDNVDIEAATRRGIMVANTTNYCNEEVASQAMAFLLACARGIFSTDRTVREGRWDLKAVNYLRRLSTQTLGLLGLGRIGAAVAERARPFGLRILTFDPYITPQRAQDLGVELVDMDTLLAQSDYVSVHTPLTPETRHIVGDELLSKMKPTAFLINVSRGGIVDQAALIRALQEGGIAGAALDVLETEPPSPDDPILKLPNVILSPHAAFYSQEALQDLRRMAWEQVISVLKGELPYSLVNREALQKNRP